MIQGANDVFQQYGIYLILCYTHRLLSEELKAIELTEKPLRRWYDFRLFLISTRKTYPLSSIAVIPVVTTNLYEIKESQNLFDCVYVDHTHAMRIATEHLIQQGA